MTDDDDLDDLLGPEPGEERKPKNQPSAQKQQTIGKADVTVVQRLHQPCSISFLAEVTGRDRRVVTRRLANLTPLSYHRGNVPLYDFRQALEHLIQPRVDARTIEKALKNMSASDLPPSLQKDVWDARLKAQKWMVNAGELWPTEDVLEVLGDAFQRLKTTTQLWIDQIADNHALPDKARQELTILVDALQSDLHRSLCEMPEERVTAAQIAQIEDDDV